MLAEVSDEDFESYEIAGRVRCDEMEKFFAKVGPDLRREKDRVLMEKFLGQTIVVRNDEAHARVRNQRVDGRRRLALTGR